jgi:hypothetical protein
MPVPEPAIGAQKALIVDGSYVLNAGRVHVNITNWGLIGSHYGLHATYSDAPSLQWPGGSGMEYVFGAGLWIGGRVNGVASVSTGQPENELLPDTNAEDVLYEARDGYQVSPRRETAPAGVPGDLPGGDDDGDGRIDEDPLDGYDNDGDGLVDEDFAQYGSQMITCLMRDDTPLARQMFPDHRPLNVEIRFSACAWNSTAEQDLIGLHWVIKNVGTQTIEDLYVGFLVDGDIGYHNNSAAGANDVAGFFAGIIRRPEGTFADLQYAWMRDADPVDPLPGWLGVTFEGSGFGDRHAVRPEVFGVNAMRIVNGVGFGWSPVLDSDRYNFLARKRRDPDVPFAHSGDYLVLLSVGPWSVLEPGQHVVVTGTMTVALGEHALQLAMLANLPTASGRWYDADSDARSGRFGRESLVCAEDFGRPWDSPQNPIYRRLQNYWNPACIPTMLFELPISRENLRYYPELDKHCLWVSMDNCEECRRFYGVDCARDRSFNNPCSSSSLAARLACTGMSGLEATIPFGSGTLPPPVPDMRVVPRDRAVEVYWDDRSERTADRLSELDDFEAYRIWRSDGWTRPPGSSERTGPSADAWQMIAEFDVINYMAPGDGEAPPMFGRNTGLEPATYRPACLDDPRFAGLADAMWEVVGADTADNYFLRPPLRDHSGRPVPGLESLLPWEGYPDVLDTFFAVTSRSDTVGVPKPATRYYRYRDGDVHNGFIYFYAVTAINHVRSPDGESILAEGIGSLPTGNFLIGQPRREAIGDELPASEQPRPFVYPNPATRVSLAEFQALHASRQDPTGVRISFANLPRCRSTIRIFTLAGDLVQTIEHDGSQGDGQAYWNLVSRNGQEVTSGIYLFAVAPQDRHYEDFVGRFVIAR